MKWTIQVNYSARDDNGKKFRARSVYHALADTIPEAYAQAGALKEFWQDVSFGAICPGHHLRLP